jgi:hypothetical protein
MIFKGKKSKGSEKNLSLCHFAHHKSQVNLGVYSEKSLSNCLGYGTAIMRYLRNVKNESRQDKNRY